MSLFNSNYNTSPLAERMRPASLDAYVGQEHLVEEGKILHKMLVQRRPFSMILWGPPGSGKTTLARIIADALNIDAHFLTAVQAGVADVRAIIKKGRENRAHGVGTLLFLDEIHRFNKAQQDSVLQAVEAGEITLIGATTENPSFSVISPLLSRAKVFKLKELDEGSLERIALSAFDSDPVLAEITIEKKVLDAIVSAGGGDARKMLGLIETAASLAEAGKITSELVSQAIHDSADYYDKGGDRHYDTISAFIKSMRGSDPNAAIYYLARMIRGGEDPVFIARRMVIFASEDIGNASPTALSVAVSTLTAVQNIGMPESRIILAQCATFLASSPKSNASYLAINKAIADQEENRYKIPLHIRNAPTKLMEELGYAKGYKYPHDFPGHFVKENYLPDEIAEEVFYHPSENGSEKQIGQRLKELWPEKYSNEAE